MSKRGADVQGTKNGEGFQGDGTAFASVPDVPKRATAAQLANRKLASIRPAAGRRPKSAMHSTPKSDLSQAGGFGQSAQSAQGATGFAFGASTPQDNPFAPAPPQPQTGGMFGNATNSFPPAQSATPSTSFVNSSFPAFGAGASTNAGFFNPTPPAATTFNFAAGGSNPFASASATPTPAVNGASSNGFSIFGASNAQPASSLTQSMPPASQALGSAFNFGASTTSATPTPSMFGQTAPTSNLFGAALKAPSPASIFDALTPAPKPTSILGAATSTPASTSILGAAAHTPAPVTFGQPPTTPSLGVSPEKKPLSPDAMQTSPDYSPAKPSGTPVTLPSSSGGSIFERISGPDPKLSPSVESSEAGSPLFAESPSAAPKENPFARLARTPSPSKETAPPATAAPKPASNPFAALNRPQGQSTPAASQGPSLFAPKFASTPSAAQTPSLFAPKAASTPSAAQTPSLFAPKAASTPFAGFSKPSEAAPSPKAAERSPSPPKQAQATPTTSSQPASLVPPPTLAPPPARAPVFAAPASSWAPTQGSPLKQFMSVPATPPSKNASPSHTSSYTPTSTPTGKAEKYGGGYTDAIRWDSEQKKWNITNVLAATYDDFVRATETQPEAPTTPETDPLGCEVWLNREKLRMLNLGMRDALNKCGLYQDWSVYFDFFQNNNKVISARIKEAVQAKLATESATAPPINPSTKRKADQESEEQDEESGSIMKKAKDNNGNAASKTAKSLEDVLNGDSSTPSPSSGLTASSSKPNFQFSGFQGVQSSHQTLNASPATSTTPKEQAPGSYASHMMRPASQAPASTLAKANDSTLLPNSIGASPGATPKASIDFEKLDQSLFGASPEPYASQSVAPPSAVSVSKAPESTFFSSPPFASTPKPTAPASDWGSTFGKQAATTSTDSPTPGFKPSSTSTAPPTFKIQPPSAAASPSGFKPSAAASPSGFKPSAAASPGGFKPSAAASPSGFQVPKFGAGAGTTNFMAQFGQNVKTAEQILEEAKKKRMADELDSEDDDYEEDRAAFEAAWEEEQRIKRVKLAEASANGPRFITPNTSAAATPVAASPSVASPSAVSPSAASDSEAAGKSLFTAPRPGSAASSSRAFGARDEESPAPSSNGGGSVFNTPALHTGPVTNIFGHLSSGANSGADAEPDKSSEESDEDEPTPVVRTTRSMKRKESEEQSEGDSFEEIMRRKRVDQTPDSEKDLSNPTAKRSIFDRITYDREEDASNPKEKSRSIFDRITYGSDGKPERELPSDNEKSNGVAQTPKPALFSMSSGDNTFKHNSPITFASAAPPPFTYTPPAATNGTSNLFGNLTAKSFGSKTPAVAGSSSGFAAPPVGSAAGGSFLSASGSASAFPSGFNSPFLSRAATPMSADEETSGVESGVDANKRSSIPEDDTQSDVQVKLTDLTAQEKADHEILFEWERSRASKHNKANAKNPWDSMGLGPIRLLKNKNDDTVRLLMRASPGGKIIINSRLLPVKATVDGKQVRITLPEEDGKPKLWVVRFGSEDAAEQLCEALNKNLPAA